MLLPTLLPDGTALKMDVKFLFVTLMNDGAPWLKGSLTRCPVDALMPLN